MPVGTGLGTGTGTGEQTLTAGLAQGILLQVMSPFVDGDPLRALGNWT